MGQNLQSQVGIRGMQNFQVSREEKKLNQVIVKNVWEKTEALMIFRCRNLRAVFKNESAQ